MADDEREENVDVHEEEEEEDWSEPVDLSTLAAGPTTTFVGGFSTIKTIQEGLARATQPGDTVMILPGSYSGDVTLDTTKLLGAEIRGDSTAERSEIIIDGKLVLEYSTPVEVHTEPTGEEGDEEGHPKPVAAPKLLRISHLTFLQGAVYNTQTAAEVDDVVFGTATRSHPVDHCMQTHALSTVTTSNSSIYGSGNSAAYLFPHSRVTFNMCDFIGAETPPPPVEGERKIRKRGAVAPPTPPPSTPSKCECDVGLYLDNASARFNKCSVSKFDIGVLANDVCPKAHFDACKVELISTVGILLENGNTTTIRSSQVKMCGRECLVVGKDSHPIVRDDVFVGDVRLKMGCIATGITDNIIGLNGNVFQEDPKFIIKGLQVVPTDPTLIKPRKAPPPEDE